MAIETLDGPWGPAGAVILCLAPIAFLLMTTLIKPLMLPSSTSLPLAAALLALVKLAYLSAPPTMVAASLLAGSLQALVPLSVVFGAIALFQSMQVTKCMPFLMYHLKQLSMGCPVAETFLVGWAFAYLIEGIGGFGAPVALGTPMLVALGHEPLPALIALVILNCLASHMGTVGMMIWFSFSNLKLGDGNLVIISGKAAILVGVPAFLIAPIAASFLCPWAAIRRAWLFVLLSVASAVIPTMAVAAFNHDIPIVVGGICSFLVTAAMIKYRVGLGRARAPGSDLSQVSCTASRAAALKAAAAEALASAAAASREPSTTGPANGAAWAADGASDDDVIAVSPCGPLSKSVVVVSRGASALTKRASGGGKGDVPPAGVDDIELGRTGASFVVRLPAAAGPAEGSAQWAATEFGGTAAADLRGNLETCSMVRLEAPLVTCSAETGSDNVDCIAAAAAPGTGAASQPPAKRQQERQVPLVVDVPPMSLRELALRTLPLTFTVVLLLLTRVPALRLVGYLRSKTPAVSADLGTLGTLHISAALVVSLTDILTTTEAFSYETLFVPCLLPFVAASFLTLAVFWRDLQAPRRNSWVRPFKDGWARTIGAGPSLMGALVLADLMLAGGAGAPAHILGVHLSTWLGRGYIAFAGPLGALSSFVGSNVVAGNLTFGTIQAAAARAIGVPVTAMLALQDAGACAGKMVSFANIVAAKAVVNLGGVHEGAIIRHTLPAAALLAALSTALSLMFLLPLPGGGFLWPDLPLPSAASAVLSAPH